MSKIYVFSTLSSSVNYPVYAKGAGDVPVVERSITIKGGANVPDKRIETPRGVVTEITGEELALLEQNEVFRLHCDNGFITVSEEAGDPEKVAADMTTRDASSPLVEQDFNEDDGVKAPTTKSKPRK